METKDLNVSEAKRATIFSPFANYEKFMEYPYDDWGFTDYDGIQDAIESRVLGMENRMETLERDIKAARKYMKTNYKEEIAKLEEKIHEHKQEIHAIKGKIYDLQFDVNSLEVLRREDITDLKIEKKKLHRRIINTRKAFREKLEMHTMNCCAAVAYVMHIDGRDNDQIAEFLKITALQSEKLIEIMSKITNRKGVIYNCYLSMESGLVKDFRYRTKLLGQIFDKHEKSNQSL